MIGRACGQASTLAVGQQELTCDLHVVAAFVRQQPQRELAKNASRAESRLTFVRTECRDASYHVLLRVLGNKLLHACHLTDLSVNGNTVRCAGAYFLAAHLSSLVALLL